jgi:hypothetical protein
MRQIFAAAVLITGLVASAVAPAAESMVSPATAASSAQAGVHEVAAVSIQRASAQLGQSGGFYRTPRYHIKLPTELDPVVDALKRAYAIQLANDLEAAINHAAEAVAKPAGDQLLQAAAQANFSDADHILHGTDDAVARQMRTQLGAKLADTLTTVVSAALDKVKGPEALHKMQQRYEQLTNRPFPAFDLVAYTREQFVGTFFAAIADQEGAIRHQPSARSTALLKETFSAR